MIWHCGIFDACIEAQGGPYRLLLHIPTGLLVHSQAITSLTSLSILKIQVMT